MKKKLTIILIYFIICFNSSIFYASAENVNTVSSPETINARILPSVWYSSLSTEEGSNIKIYTAVQNNSGLDFTGTATFSVDSEDTANVVFNSISVHLQEISAPWSTTSGTHHIKVSIKTSLPPDKNLISYETDSVSLSIDKKVVLKTAHKVTSITIPNYITVIDTAVAPVVTKIESLKKPIVNTTGVYKSSGKSNNIAAPAGSKDDNSSVLGISTEAFSNFKENKADNLFNLAITGIALVVKNWLWSLPVFFISLWKIFRWA